MQPAGSTDAASEYTGPSLRSGWQARFLVGL